MDKVKILLSVENALSDVADVMGTVNCVALCTCSLRLTRANHCHAAKQFKFRILSKCVCACV